MCIYVFNRKKKNKPVLTQNRHTYACIKNRIKIVIDTTKVHVYIMYTFFQFLGRNPIQFFSAFVFSLDYNT